MKKINNKGIGHHLLLMVVAVVAVIGAAGYFVWQRQQDNDIDAKAAGMQKIMIGIEGDLYVCKAYNSNGGYRLKGQIYASPTGGGFKGGWWWQTKAGNFPASKSLPYVNAGTRSGFFYSSDSVPRSTVTTVQGITVNTGC